MSPPKYHEVLVPESGSKIPFHIPSAAEGVGALPPNFLPDTPADFSVAFRFRLDGPQRPHAGLVTKCWMPSNEQDGHRVFRGWKTYVTPEGQIGAIAAGNLDFYAGLRTPLSQPILDGRWHDVVLSVSSTKMTIWLDGVPTPEDPDVWGKKTGARCQNNTEFGRISSDGPLLIGSDYLYGEERYLKGEIPVVHIYCKALEDADKVAESTQALHAVSESAQQAQPVPPPSNTTPEAEGARGADKKKTPPEDSMSARQYLDATVVPTLLPAMNEVAMQKPEDPIEFLARYLLQNNPLKKNGTKKK
uniref:Uncharacterized protein n=1 Tax=Chromera velia CCMP2878 TaxID=1169474 RepID=A0A0G4GKE3_9ALVE|eukprot:Cvel_4825.t1-p1 / transcript=Cvel_4825.t1 / gene=Cvel_4825 / organism=Chromera_velia_CCMP2878 / gene_product=Dosage compensation protein dpy-30, putative / transcript_product=Dosage compensation protein dpy-30, putative / location=Cvel_scaffold217:71679-72584(+) / protein_length=302 / sequence_SO=supercontig / SO=protein_coding / is_pseudo=false